MRTLGFTLLIASILLGSGGVAVRGQAEGSAAADAAQAAAGECSAGAAGAAADAKPQVRPSPLAPAASGAKQVIILNTRGHNYRRPGDPPVTPVEVVPAAPSENDADPQ